MTAALSGKFVRLVKEWNLSALGVDHDASVVQFVDFSADLISDTYNV